MAAGGNDPVHKRRAEIDIVGERDKDTVYCSHLLFNKVGHHAMDGSHVILHLFASSYAIPWPTRKGFCLPNGDVRAERIIQGISQMICVTKRQGQRRINEAI